MTYFCFHCVSNNCNLLNVVQIVFVHISLRARSSAARLVLNLIVFQRELRPVVSVVWSVVSVGRSSQNYRRFFKFAAPCWSQVSAPTALVVLRLTLLRHERAMLWQLNSAAYYWLCVFLHTCVKNRLLRILLPGTVLRFETCNLGKLCVCSGLRASRSLF